MNTQGNETSSSGMTATKEILIHDHLDVYKRDFVKKVTRDVIENTVEHLLSNQVDIAMETLTKSDKLAQFVESLQKILQGQMTNEIPTVIVDLNQSHEFAYPPVKDYEEYYSTGTVGKNLNVTVGTVKNRISKSCYVGAKFKGETDYKLPAWQFHQGLPIAGVDDILDVLKVNGVAAIRKFTMQMMRFDNRRIIDVLREGDIELAKKMASYLVE